MIIGFATGNFYKLFSDPSDGFSSEYLNYYRVDGLAKAIEIHLHNEKTIDFLLEKDNIDLSSFSFVSVHAPELTYFRGKRRVAILEKLKKLKKKYKVNNFIFHTDEKIDWSMLNDYLDLSVSIENMDEQKQFGKTFEEIAVLLENYPFNFTLDLQHCFVNDESMKLARDFQRKFKERIVEYHISGYKEGIKHYPLFKTRQDIIIDSLENKNIPIIIESIFDRLGEQKQEIDYIKKKLS